MDQTRDETRPFRVLFVCTGNTCRSPLAAVLARRALDERGWTHVEVSSAGAAAVEGGGASEGSLRAAERHGLDLTSHRSATLTRQRVEEADLILAMSPTHMERVVELGGGGKVSLLRAFAEGREGEPDPDVGPVADPFGGDDATYEETYRALEHMVEQSLDRLEPLVAP